MPGKNKTPMVGWHPPADLQARLKALTERRNVTRTAILTAALREYLDRNDSPAEPQN